MFFLPACRSCCHFSFSHIVVAAAVLMSSAAVLVAQPANNNCANAIDITNGPTQFSTINATTDGPAHPGSCMFDGQTYEDIWFRYTATCTGQMTATTCNTTTYDSDLVVYNGCDCGTLSSHLLGCNDDGTGCANFSSIVIVPVVLGQCYFIRVGGWNAGNEGTGTLNVSCVDLSTTPGACCHTDDTCTQEVFAGCNAIGGTFQGVNTPCSPNPCIEPPGACCFEDDTCSQEVPEDCNLMGGTFQGFNLPCSPNPCAQSAGGGRHLFRCHQHHKLGHAKQHPGLLTGQPHLQHRQRESPVGRNFAAAGDERLSHLWRPA